MSLRHTHLRFPRHLAALVCYAVFAVVYTLPLIFHFSDRVPGVMNDAPYWIWDLWYFRFALTALHVNPLWTDFIYWPYHINLIVQPGVFYKIVGFVLQPLIGLTRTYNLLLLSNIVLAGYGVFLISLEWGAEWSMALVAGALFAFAPPVTQALNQGSGFDVLSVQVLPFFLWMLSRAIRSHRLGDAALAALCLTWVWSCSYYYFLFCLVLIPLHFIVLEKPFRFYVSERPVAPWVTGGAFLAGTALLADALWLVVSLRSGQRQFHGKGSMSTLALYVAPYLIFWGLIAARLGLKYSVCVSLDKDSMSRRRLFPYAATIVSYAILNLPLIIYILSVVHGKHYGSPLHPWRGGGNPTDVWDIVRPSSFHPLWGQWFRRHAALDAFDMGYVGFVPLASTLWLWRRCRTNDPYIRLWFAGAVFSAVWTLGPWLKIFGLHTYLLLPFYFLHLLPFYNNLQVGSRFIPFVLLFLALLFAASLKEMKMRMSGPAASWLPLIAFGGLVMEFAHPGLPLLNLEIPALFQRMGDRPSGAILPIPMGAIFDGLDAAGAIGSVAMLPHYQIAHRKPYIGGAVGRAPRYIFDQMKEDPFISALVSAQSGAAPSPFLGDPQRVARFFQKMNLTYVVLFMDETPAALQEMVARWPVELIDEDKSIKLFLFHSNGVRAPAIVR